MGYVYILRPIILMLIETHYSSKSNILIDSDGKAFLADFGLSSNACGPSYAIPSTGGSVRWAAPEHFRVLYDSCPSTATTHGDIYSYGSVMLQVSTDIHRLWT